MTIRAEFNKDSFGLEGYASHDENTINLLDLKMDADDSFSFGSFSSQSMSCPSSCPSTSGSFSSASSLYDALTPPSRNSTPQHPMDFHVSFGNDAMMLDFASPHSSASGCFPLDMKTTAAPDNMLCPGMPMTPSRHSNSSMTLQGSLDFTPHSMDPYDFMDTFMVPTPSPLFGNNLPNCDMASIWHHHTDGSPIVFERTSSPAMPMATPTPGPLGSSHSNTRRRIVMNGPQEKSVMLQQNMPKAHPNKNRTPKGKPATGKLPPLQEGFKVSKLSKVPPNRHRCEHPECNGKSYSRQEHLKRHLNEAHSENPEKWQCNFCETPKTFGRCDNFRDHLKRHIGKSAGSRTKHEMGAAIKLAEMESRMKNKKKREPNAATPPKPRGNSVVNADVNSGDTTFPISSMRQSVKVESCQ